MSNQNQSVPIESIGESKEAKAREYLAMSLYVRDVSLRAEYRPCRWRTLSEKIKSEWRAEADRLVDGWWTEEENARRRREEDRDPTAYFC